MNQKTYSKTDIWGNPKSHEAALKMLQSSPETYAIFQTFPEKYQTALLEFFAGERSLDIQMDPFFKKIMDPQAHPERLESLISSVLGEEIKIDHILPNEGIHLTDKGSFVIMDVAARLKNGSYIDVEMQKIGYQFPAQRTECYLSDMTMRQYNLLRSQLGSQFSYNHMKKTYLFIIMAESTSEFHSSEQYIHTRQTSYSSGITLPETENITYITLDTFQKSVQNIDSISDAWMVFLSHSDMDSIIQLVNKFPQFLPLYKEIAEFRKNPKEVISMFSEALYIMDKNMERLMVDELREEKEALLKDISSKKEELASKNKDLASKDEALASKDKELASKDEEIDYLKAQLAALQPK